MTRFGSLLENCLVCGLMEQIMEILSMVYEDLAGGMRRLPLKAPKVNSDKGSRRYIGPQELEASPAETFLALLVTIWQKHQLVTPHPLLKDLFMLLFMRYLLADKLNPSPKPQGWAHKPRYCSMHNPSQGNLPIPAIYARLYGILFAHPTRSRDTSPMP